MAKLTDEERRALQLLARSPNGCTEALMLAHRFTIDALAEMAVDGLLTIEADREDEHGQRKVARMQITPAGRRAITD
jgi:hypothetical protein